jgi:large subunit ribosomal protein L5
MKQQPRLRQHYEKQVIARLQESFGFKNSMEVPRVEKVVINCGLGDAKDNAKLLDSVVGSAGRSPL